MKWILALTLCLVTLSAPAQNKRIDQYGIRISPNAGDLFLLEDNLYQAYWTQSRSNLNAQFVQQNPNAWAGPTNTIDLNVAVHNNGDLYYTTFTPVSVTGFANKNLLVQTATLSVFNGASTNVTMTLPPSLLTRDGARSYTLTNGQLFIISFRYHAGLNLTNSVNCPNF
jgi:hypothetical protein